MSSKRRSESEARPTRNKPWTVGKQVEAMIDLALTGAPVKQIVENVARSIKETYTSLHIGTVVKTNQAVSGQLPDGTTVSIPEDTVLSVLNPFMGKVGEMVMCMTRDGKHAIVPLESISPMAEAEINPSAGAPSTGKATEPAKVQGDALPSGDAKAPMSAQQAIDAAVQGDPLPDDPTQPGMTGDGVIDGDELGDDLPDDDPALSTEPFQTGDGTADSPGPSESDDDDEDDEDDMDESDDKDDDDEEDDVDESDDNDDDDEDGDDDVDESDDKDDDDEDDMDEGCDGDGPPWKKDKDDDDEKDESRRQEIIAALRELDQNDLAEQVSEMTGSSAIAKVHSMLFGPESHTLEDLKEVLEANLPAHKKGARGKHRGKKTK